MCHTLTWSNVIGLWLAIKINRNDDAIPHFTADAIQHMAFLPILLAFLPILMAFVPKFLPILQFICDVEREEALCHIVVPGAAPEKTAID